MMSKDRDKDKDKDRISNNLLNPTIRIIKIIKMIKKRMMIIYLIDIYFILIYK